ncbi:hypothetical protein [Tautonia plasticadhaerens]|uniref:Uncharacterized protein n=1 Tax=Tautonia plasticadhaerens TaxID=2527974 RepID=A0A518GWW2_9BACT|nr:hypothetical protein [Tautonia plasticadhaerens]QDV33084.1 hypothetical protein ElP_09260 [Tautonia plasticadhaerens]
MPPEPSDRTEVLAIGPKIRALPIIHGSGDCAIRAREELLAHPYDCLAVPLPPSFRGDVEEAVDALPSISVVLQRDAEGETDGFTYVPVDPCQPVVAAIRTAMGERIARAFVDLESPRFEGRTGYYPDPYALKRVRVEGFASAILPGLPPPDPEGSQARRHAWMANRLRELEDRHESILFVCSITDWPWVRDAYQRRAEAPEPEWFLPQMRTCRVDPKTLIFLLGELPYITGLYERGRRELTPDDNLSVDGVKEMLLASRERLRKDRPKVARRITPQLLSVYFRYVRNLSLVERRLTPDLYSLVMAAKQTAGDDLALALGETAREYPYHEAFDRGERPWWWDEPPLRMGDGRAEVPSWGTAAMTSRLPGQAIAWRSCELRPRPPEPDQKKWKQRWDPYGMCSYPPEDQRIESFQRHVADQARAILGADLARSEKFTTSVRDGIDIRETLRNWHKGDLYVKVIPPSRGSIDAVVFLFDVPADPKVYVHRATWFAEHAEESTLAFFATDPMQNLVGPGIAQAEYGGALFLYPPRLIPDIWEDPRLRRLDTLEERLIGGALLHSKERHVALVCPKPPPASWRRLARRHGRKLVHLPLRKFSGQLLERLRTFHVLNGKHVRSYAADFIREM